MKSAMQDWQEKWVQAIGSYPGSVKNKAVATAIENTNNEFSFLGKGVVHGCV